MRSLYPNFLRRGGAPKRSFRKEIEKDYKSRLGDIITTEHASALIGENNAKNLVQSGGVKVEALMSAIEIANNIQMIIP